MAQWFSVIHVVGVQGSWIKPAAWHFLKLLKVSQTSTKSDQTAEMPRCSLEYNAVVYLVLAVQKTSPINRTCNDLQLRV